MSTKKAKATKSRAGTGSVYQRGDGRWTASIRYTEPISGEKKRRTVYGSTRAEAEARLEEVRAHIAANEPVRLSQDSTGAAVRHWAAAILPLSGRKPSTIEDYEQLVEARIVPGIGHVPLADLTPDRINVWAAQMLTGTADTSPLKPSSVRKILATLAIALDHTVERQQLRTNPARAKSIAHPKDEHRDVHWYSSDQIHAIRSSITGEHRLDPVLELLIETGMRRGEALGLRWRDIDREGRRVHITGALSRVRTELMRQSPKTAAGRRTVPLTPRAIAAFEQARAWQEADAQASEHWKNSAGYVFTVAHGGPVDPRNLARHFTAVQRAAGITEGSLHSLRHSWATFLLLSGQPIHAVSRLLGHSSIRQTADVYSHATVEDLASIVEAGLTGYGDEPIDNVVRLRA